MKPRKTHILNYSLRIRNCLQSDYMLCIVNTEKVAHSDRLHKYMLSIQYTVAVNVKNERLENLSLSF